MGAVHVYLRKEIMSTRTKLFESMNKKRSDIAKRSGAILPSEAERNIKNYKELPLGKTSSGN